ncbi:MAG: carboxylate-amine ligase [Alphaproteobacteria bacterium]|nr:MAG: carboxylate-amine ligase [Caulobacteraceae bacterium]TPW06729.1 MAG: carboxylate-amine ligase [Alphaproteobacteria bacterium]
MLQCQVETVTQPHVRVSGVAGELRHLRASVSAVGEKLGIGLLSAGTNPVALWREQKLTEKERYGEINRDLGMIGLRNLVCGMHVHVAPPADVDRIWLMNRMLPRLPLLFALSTSSPFWEGRPTGLVSYRLAAYRELPRTGLPPAVSTQDEYDAYIGALVGANVIPDASYVWWAIRPSLNYPTLELRISDACTRVEDTAAIAALYQCLLVMLVEEEEDAPVNGPYNRAIAEENLWRVQRYGLAAPFIDCGTGSALPIRECISALVQKLESFAIRLQCVDELAHVNTLLDNGTSAECQLELLGKAIARGESLEAGMKEVVHWLMRETEGRPS